MPIKFKMLRERVGAVENPKRNLMKIAKVNKFMTVFFKKTIWLIKTPHKECLMIP
jgi:hypothetical protein